MADALSFTFNINANLKHSFGADDTPFVMNVNLRSLNVLKYTMLNSWSSK